MSIKRVKHCLYYRETKIMEYVLLTGSSPRFINSKIKGIKSQIETVYYSSISHSSSSDVFGSVSISYSLEKLAIHILERKAELDIYTKWSGKKLALSKEVVKGYTPGEQKEVMYYIRSNGVAVDSELTNRLRCDLYKATHPHKVGVKAWSTTERRLSGL